MNRIIASIVCLFVAPVFAASKTKDYENFTLPKAKSGPSVPDSALSFQSDKIKIKAGKVRMREVGISAQQYVFAKEAFISEKRDQAIKLLRQEMDSNYSANRDNMLLRLGQLYAEKYMELSYRETELYTSQIQEYEKRKATDKSAKPAKLDNSRSQKYLKDALKIFYTLEKEYPKHDKLDEIIFFIGFVEMELGHGPKGAGYLERLVKKYPRSRKYDESVVYLGDYYFDHHKFPAALEKFRILARKTDSPLYFYSQYKIAWAELNTGQQKKGLEDMKGLVLALKDTTDKAKFNLREQAMKDLVIFYGEAGKVDEAMAFFDENLGKEKAVSNLRLIADILKSKARDEEAVHAYMRLLQEYPNAPDAPQMTVSVADSQMRIGKTDAAVNTLVHAMEQYGPTSDWAKSYPSDKKAELQETFKSIEEEAKRVAFFLHAAGQKGSQKKLYANALRLYTAMLESFPNHPDRKKIAFYRAEILFGQDKWLEAADAYMAAAKIPPKDKMTDECVYNALLSVDRLTERTDKIHRYSKEEQQKVDLNPEDIPDAEKRFIEIAEYYIKEYPKGDRVVDVRFRIAAIYYRHRHFDKALQSFNDIAAVHPKHRSAVTAANIVLDIYNIRKDYESLDSTAQRYAAMPNLGDAAFKAEMAQISSQISFKQIEKTEAQNRWGEAAEAYLKVYRSNPNGPLAEKALYNALISFEKAGDVPKSADTTRQFIAKYPKSEYTQRLTLTLAKSAEKQYDFDQAQKLYLDYYRKFPKEKEARKALYNAAVFSELLEQNRQAVSLYQEYLKGNVSGEEKRSINLSLAKLYRKEGNWPLFNQTYRRLIHETASVDGKLQLYGELAKHYEKAGRIAERNNIVMEIKSVYENAGRKAKDPGLAIFYLAENRFRAVAPERTRYEQIPLRFPEQDLVYLLKRKVNALSKLAKSYDAVVELGVPEWGVAALYEKSDAYSNYVKSFRAIAIPKKYKDAELEEVRKSLKQLETRDIAPLEQKAQEYAQVCAAKAAEFHVANEYAAKCRRLAEKSEGGAPAGLVPQPSYWATRISKEGVAKK